ncbi:cytochrome P450, putative [Talaromyces stipitatus ATCC 10500]|uniref:Cytochrome P450, putative n=1 Tax=Talaromyces stipitatus (strain ATCC 10500 / CBS 375.48 / QM 6759 / NRRL 1006) TaxID=441959 RepID=B8MM58_TALSN|nr:cytochrome P450, putative [Talaromyces stipitatus ATCC 10500]EED13570.1 cytochrome P450, putative [Talaromyces stipitatus ATCC 10500]
MAGVLDSLSPKLLEDGRVLGVTIIAILAITILLRRISQRFSSDYQFWKSQPWAGIRSELFSGTRAYFRSFFTVRDMVENGYHSYSTSRKAFVLPVFGGKPWIVLPKSSAKDLISRSDSELSSDDIHIEQLQVNYTLGPKGVHLMRVPLQFDVLRRQLTRKLPLLTGAVYDELDKGFKQYWGTDTTNWVEVEAFPTCLKLVTRAANRVFAGEEICRNEDFLEHSKQYTQGTVFASMALRLIPKVLRPLASPILLLHNNQHFRVCARICVPVVQERIRNTKAKQTDESFEWEPPVDALQWLVEECINTEDPKELDPVLITRRLLLLNMVAIHTTSISITHAILNVNTFEHSEQVIASLREECNRLLGENNGVWTKAALNDALRLDSTIKESMRCDDLEPFSTGRMVVHPNGIDIETSTESSLHVPHGVTLCLPSHGIHRDPEYYYSPLEFRPFRFSEPREVFLKSQKELPREQSSASDVQGSIKQTALDLKTTALVTTSDTYLAFGHGRHACPGRFFAAQEMKLMLAYVLQNYDIEKLSEKPPSTMLMGTNVPNEKAKIRVKRRA